MGKAPTELNTVKLSHLRSILDGLDSRFRVSEAPEWASLVNYSSKFDEPVHRWFRNREGYSLQLVRRLLAGLDEGSQIVDPFCGSGTTLFVAKNMGYRSVGLDVNPLSVFVTRVKTRHYTREDLNHFEQTCNEIRRLTPDDPASNKPALSIIDKAFLPGVLRALLVYKHFINSHLVRKERDFFFLAWLSILEEVSNVYKEGNGIKYRNRKRTSSGYVDIPIAIWQQSIFPEDKFGHVENVFLQRVRMMIADLRHSKGGEHEPLVFEGDALALDDFVEPDSTAMVAFSPPYANNFNYFKAFKIELWMGDFVDSYEEMRELTRHSMRSHVETSLSRDSDEHNWYPEQLDDLISLMDPDALWTQRIPKALRGYFFDMHQALERIFEILELGGQCVVVVGNSAYGSILIPTDSLLAETAEAIGFDIERIAVARHLTTSSQQKLALEPVRAHLRESLLFLKKTRRTVHWTLNKENGYARQRHVSELPKFPKSSSRIVYVIRNRGLTDITHGIHRFPGKFIPHIPRWAIQKYLVDQQEQVVLDPFCGSGTTLVEARLLGQHAYGIDINPLARLITKVKTTPIDSQNLEDVVNAVAAEVKSRSTPTFRPKIDTLEHWFNPDAIQSLGVIRDVIDQWKHINKDVYDFLLVSFSAIIRRASNADDQSLKTYVSGTHPKIPPDAIHLFLAHLEENAERITQYKEEIPVAGSARILDFHDARSFAEEWKFHNLPLVDLGVTSPPYVKTIDYVYSQMAEYFWIGDAFNLESQEKQNEHKQIYIGTEKVRADVYEKLKHTEIDQIDSLVDRIYESNSKHAYILYRFFTDIQKHFGQMREIMQEKGRYVVVIGDSTVSDIVVETHLLLPLCASREGFELESYFPYEIRNRHMRFPRQGRGGQVDLDWVLTFKPKSI